MKLSHELKTAIAAAKAAGQIQMKYFGTPLRKKFKESQDLVTHVDFEAETKILSMLKKEFPEYGVLSEEKGRLESDSDYQWIIDPLDGTFYYSHNYPAFGVLIALKKKNSIEMGVSFQPSQNILMFAQKNKGAYLNGKKMRVSKQKTENGALLGYSDARFSLDAAPKPFNQLLQNFFWRTGIPAFPAFSYLSQGILDAYLYNYIHYKKNTVMHPWDIAAHKIIVEEAGGKFSNYRGETDLDKIQSVVAANPYLHKKIIKLFRGETK
ncbi:MAG: inositol monophosphatase [Candidatus Micrarchaeota archaeon]